MSYDITKAKTYRHHLMERAEHLTYLLYREQAEVSWNNGFYHFMGHSYREEAFLKELKLLDARIHEAELQEEEENATS